MRNIHLKHINDMSSILTSVNFTQGFFLFFQSSFEIFRYFNFVLSTFSEGHSLSSAIVVCIHNNFNRFLCDVNRCARVNESSCSI